MIKPFEVSAFPISGKYRLQSFCSIQGKETEHNWADRDQAVQRVRGMIKGGIHTRYYDTFMTSLKESFIKDSIKTVYISFFSFFFTVDVNILPILVVDSWLVFVPQLQQTPVRSTVN
jgi:hypothetical protein